ncbi:hypothetical protein P280DRAFT_511942 [Massarina eburnea CBS 473.64]|uniref:Clr5 domain-containing protein n=1 Tax=Massarina eburnea CBS 473.64 TaxID=1395130 RepID=A0A6A6RH12_9PLEO|nr:hypothetical protein P280DRAFT_511942 [Massarina eburnea CBS 473.64]
MESVVLQNLETLLQQLANMETPSLSREIPQRGPRPHSAIAWEKIQPSLKYYYIDLDMTLKKTMEKIKTEHNFHASSKMYKRRLKAWNFTKNIKAEEKEKALIRLIRSEPAENENPPIRHDKLVRYAKSRMKSGALETYHIGKTLKNPTIIPKYRRIPPQTPSMPPSLTLLDDIAKFDKFLRAVRACVDVELMEWISGTQPSIDTTIFGALERGMSLWRMNAFKAARRSFGEAARKTIEDLHGDRVSILRITYCISSTVWGSNRETVLQKFSEFLAKAALEALGPGCPMTIMLQYLQRAQSVEAHLKMCACVLHNYEISARNVTHWWNIAGRRWRLARKIGKLDLAVEYCLYAVGEARRIDGLTAEMESEAQVDLDSMEEEKGGRRCELDGLAGTNLKECVQDVEKE